MGILDYVSGLEDVMSEKEAPERLKQKPKKAEAAKPDLQLNSRLEKIEDSVASLKEAVEDLRNIAQPTPAEAQTSLEMMERMQSDIEALRETVGSLGKGGGKDYSGEIGELKKSVSEIRNSIVGGAAKGGEPIKAQAKDLLELKSRMDILQKYVDGRMSAFQAPQKEGAGRSAEEIMNNRLNEFSRKIDEISKYASGKTTTVSGANRNIEENLKLFALNSDVEKVWKEAESLRRYVDEKTKMADGLANSLRIWETRNMQLMEKERDFDEKLKTFPELKMLESRIRKTERALVELQKHFVAAQITEPIIME